MADRPISMDETRILQLAAAPPEDLFPVLHRDGAFLPLIALLAVLPGLYAVRVRPFDEMAAAWGIRAVEMAGNWQKALDPSELATPAGVRWAPPLASWLTAAALEAPRAARRGALSVVSYASTAGLVLALFWMWRRISGHRFAFWVAIAAAFHGPFLRLAQDPAPHALALFLGVASAASYARHALRRRDSFLTWALFASGALLGLCMLAGGPLAIVVFAILALWTVWQSRGRRPEDPRRPGLDLRFALGGLGVLALVAAATGGWWPLMMVARHGRDFLTSWWWQWAPAGTLPAAASIAGRAAWAGARLLSICGLLTWPALLGLLATVRRTLNRDEADARGRRMLWSWVALSIPIWLTAALFAGGQNSPTLWDALLLVPCLGLTAAGLEVFARGRAGLITAAIVAVGTLFLGTPWVASILNARALTPAAVMLVMAALGAALAILWWLRKGFGEQERLVRWAAGVLALAPFGANAFAGLHAIDRRGPDERAIAAIRDQFHEVPDAAEVVLISVGPRPVPLPLEYVLRSQWVDAGYSVAANWDAALAWALDARPADLPVVIVDWNPRATRQGDFRYRGVEVRQLKSAPIYAERVVHGYVATRRQRDAASRPPASGAQAMEFELMAGFSFTAVRTTAMAYQGSIRSLAPGPGNRQLARLPNSRYRCQAIAR